ncbi:hypothetical protein CXB51_025460 [Gossypium anomalum]|uniref:Uncharacterized protein n=1 Tax=Gossypium anomalum TaxID=47600 RepID=A0A8J5YAC1_9ROSI|nr:hypothetical protein CXB51_025460 [Gossypium anomalum]
MECVRVTPTTLLTISIKVGDILKNLKDKNYTLPQIVCISDSQLLEIRFCYEEKKLSTAPVGWGVKLAIPKLPKSFYPMVLEGRML